MTTYIKDLIDLPEKVHGGDFVLKLTEGVENPERTLAPYVVTEQLSTCFANALDFIKGAVQSNSSKAAYLHGSFGSGKSHFMAVLHLMLQGNPLARAKEGLESVVSEHGAWIEGKKFLLVPYHMIGQRSMEAAVLGGYVRKILELHPDAPIPGVYLAEGLFEDAKKLRLKLGDDRFFEELNASTSGAGGWGDLESAWDSDSFEAALEAAPGTDERSRLIGSLVQEFFQSYKDVARGSDEAFVSLDDGLAIISRHAQSLGYDALILFLDELILWLATHAADQHFLNTEGPKVSKLVESESADRPIPIVSFVARQRDLRDLVGESVTGAEELGFAQVLDWWQARFDTITLEDRNLPEIASRRILKPKSASAKQQLDESWAETEKIRDEVLSTLLTPRADRSVFRKVYPFSPALIETLVAVSSVLQRERTALKVMLQLLVNQRDTLELGQIIPVGDLFDVIEQGDEPFTEGMRIHFENARRLYHQKLLPMLEKEHELTHEEWQSLPHDDPDSAKFRTDDRLLKTMLLAALVPEVEVLKGLNSARLSALNHGSVKSPIPGRERQMVSTRLTKWSSQVGEIKVGDEADPTVSLQLSGVDTAAIIANGAVADNIGNRRRKIRELLFKQLEIENKDDLFLEHEVTWWGVRHRFQVIYGNVRELTNESLQAKGGVRKAILDFPFDDQGHSPREDLARLDDFRQGGKPSRTLAWIPAFLSPKAQKELGVLVVLDEILKNDETFRSHASHLSAVDQSQAKVLLDNQQRQLRLMMIRYLEGAYGVATPVKDSLDESHSPADHFQSLDPAFTPQPPVGANLCKAFEALLHQMLENQFPAHPRFGASLTIGVLRKVQGEIERALQDPDGRISIERQLRGPMNEIAVPLKLGEMGETHFVLGRHWYNHFGRELDDGAMVTVGGLRAAIDRPKPMGLTEAAQDLIIMLYADQSDCSFLYHGGAYSPKLGELRDELELRKQPLPSLDDWKVARDRAARIFGLSASELRNASNVAELAARLTEKSGQQVTETCQKVADRLSTLCADYGIEASTCNRLTTISRLLSLLRSLAVGQQVQKIEALANAEVATSPEAMGTCFNKLADVDAALEATQWSLFEAISRLEGEQATEASAILAALKEALSHDEMALALRSRLKKLEADSIRLLTPPTKQSPRTEVSEEVEILSASEERGLSASDAERELNALLAKLKSEPEAMLDLKYSFWRKRTS